MREVGAGGRGGVKDGVCEWERGRVRESEKGLS